MSEPARERRGPSLFGIPLEIEPNWIFIASLVAWSLATTRFPELYPYWPPLAYWIMGISAAALLFACVVLHELGHSLAARRFGIPVACVTLFLFGGVAHILREAQRPSVEFRIALAGPLVSMGLALVFFGAALWLPVHSMWQAGVHGVVVHLALVNVALAVFNLLPGFPLDGGRIVRAIVWALTGNVCLATRIASGLGVVIGAGLFGLGLYSLSQGERLGGLWYLLLGWFLAQASFRGFQGARDLPREICHPS